MNMNHLPQEIQEMIYRHVVRMSRKSDAFKKELVDVWFLRQWKKAVSLSYKNIESMRKLIDDLPETLDRRPLERLYEHRLKKTNIHHIVTVENTDYSRMYLGFDSNIWKDILTHYLDHRLGLRIDGKKISFKPWRDPYYDMCENISKDALNLPVDIKIALEDFLISEDCLVEKWEDIECYGKKSYSSTWLHMLRNYMNLYYPDIRLQWCNCSTHPHWPCDHRAPMIENDDLIYVSMLTLLCDFHAGRSGW